MHYVDCGVSGGVWGLTEGYGLMAGGDDAAIERLTPVLRSLAPGVDAAPRTPGRSGPPAPEEEGWIHCGPSGAGHFVKMVHNGIEYGMMAAYAEGLNLLEHANAGAAEQEVDAETTPLRDPEHYRYEIDTAKVAEAWRRGTVVRSLAARPGGVGARRGPDARRTSPGASRTPARAAGRRSRRSTRARPTPVLTAALQERFSSRGEADFADRLLSAMREQFGGHAEKPGARRPA